MSKKKRPYQISKVLLDQLVAKALKESVKVPSNSEPEVKGAESTLAKVRLQVSTFRKGMEENGLGKLDFSGFLKSGALVMPFWNGIQLAMMGSSDAALGARANFDAFDVSMTDLSMGM